jgi:hypothetical protein
MHERKRSGAPHPAPTTPIQEPRMPVQDYPGVNDAAAAPLDVYLPGPSRARGRLAGKAAVIYEKLGLPAEALEATRAPPEALLRLGS